MQIGLTCCVGCRKEYYSGSRQVLLHRDCLNARKMVVTPKDVVVTPTDLVVTNDLTVVTNDKVVVTKPRSLDRHKDQERHKEYMRLYMQKKRSEVRVNG